MSDDKPTHVLPFPGVEALISDMANKLAPGRLECSECGCQLDVSPENAAAYLTHGWPKCCEYTMTLVTR